MDILQNLIDEVAWRYKIGTIDKINADTVSDVIEEIYPRIDPNEAEGLIFEALMRYTER